MDILYSLVLGRPADAAGRAHWINVLGLSGDATAVLAGLMASDEARGRNDGSRHACDELGQRALQLLGRPPRVVDVGAQDLVDEQHVYAGLGGRLGEDVIGFDPLEDRLRQRQQTGAGSMDLLPYALGDGREHLLHINNDDATSSLFPLNDRHNASFNHLSTLRTVRTEALRTRRLDEVLPDGPVDFLKLDVQGAELLVLQGGPQTLARTAAVHCEVEFAPIYSGQPLAADVDRHLRAAGFVLVDYLVPVRYSYLVHSHRNAPDRLLWADAVYMRETMDPEMLFAQALVAAHIYGKPTLAEHLLERAVESVASSVNRAR